MEPTGPYILGVDLSHWDKGVDFHALVAAGVKFAFFKATEGVDGVDPMYAEFRARAKEVGLISTAYHFLDDSGPADAQIAHFLKVANLGPGDFRCALDTETQFDGVGDLSAQCVAVIKATTKWEPWLYSDLAFYIANLSAITSCPTWVADYGAFPTVDTDIWQYTETGEIPGCSGNLDLNKFYGDSLAAHIYPSFPVK